MKDLNLSNNKLKSIQPFLFGFLYQLNDLNLAANNLSRLYESCFLNLHKLQILKLSFNRLNSTDFLRDNRIYTKNNWPIIDVTERSIEEISAMIIQYCNRHKQSI